jgi:hypothetical protein
MSMMDGRQAIIDALNTYTPHVKANVKRSATLKPGDAWVRWAGAEDAQAGYNLMITWNAIIVLSQQEDTADAWLSEHLEGVVDAVRPAAFVVSAQPVEIATSAGSHFGLQITCQSEE